MPYTTKQKLIEAYGEDHLVSLTDRAAEPTGVIDDAVLAAGIAKADAEIDSFLAGRYRLPLSQVPDLVNELATTMTRFHLHRYEPPEYVRKAYDDALKALREIATGTRLLQAAGLTPAAAPANSAAPAFVGPNRSFSRDSMKGL